jgi:putative tricarboxylic transport membrane protein
MTKPQTFLSLGVLALGLLFLVGSFGLPSEAGYAGVGPNFLPLLVGCMLSVCGGFLVWESCTGGFKNLEEPSGAESADWLPFVWVSAGIVLNAVLITHIGFIFSCALCFVLAAQGFRRSEAAGSGGVKALTRDVVIGLLIAAPVYWMFSQLLDIKLPSITSTGWL